MSTPALSEGSLLPAKKEVMQEPARLMQEVMKAVEEVNKRVEEAREMAKESGESLQRDLEGANLQERCAAYETLVKKETCMQQQIDDLLGKQDHMQKIIIDLEENQKLDQRLSEERSISVPHAEERDRAGTEAQEKDTRVLALTQELESQRASKEALKRELAAIQEKLSMALTDVDKWRERAGKYECEVDNL